MTSPTNETEFGVLEPRALANLKELLKTSPLAAVAMLEGSSEARGNIMFEEIVAVFDGTFRAADERCARLLQDFYMPELSYYLAEDLFAADGEVRKFSAEEQKIRKSLHKWPAFNYKKGIGNRDKTIREEAFRFLENLGLNHLGQGLKHGPKTTVLEPLVLKIKKRRLAKIVGKIKKRLWS